MKKYFAEANKRQWEKPTEPLQVNVATAKTIVYAESEAEALEKAAAVLKCEYHGSGTILGEVRLTGCADLPVDFDGTDPAGQMASNIIV